MFLLKSTFLIGLILFLKASFEIKLSVKPTHTQKGHTNTPYFVKRRVCK